MTRNNLVDRIVDVCLGLGIIKYSSYTRQIKSNIKLFIVDVTFIENLYNEIFIKAKHRNLLNTKKIKKLLIELEKVRLELEV